MARKSRKPNPDDLFEKAQEHYEDGEMEEAEQLLHQARELASSTGNAHSLGPILNLLAGVYRATDRVSEALDACLAALAIAQENDTMEPVHLGYLHDNIAQILTRLGRPDDALAHYGKSTVLMMDDEDEPDVESTLRSLHAMADILDGQGREEAALECLRRGVEITRQAQSWEEISVACAEYVTALIEAERPAEAEALVNECLAELETMLAQPRNLRAVVNPSAMAFEEIKAEHQKSGTAPMFMLRLLVMRSRARAAMGNDDGVPANLPAHSKFEADMLAFAHDEWAQSHLELAIELHQLGQTGSRPAAYEAAEVYYRKAADIAQQDDDEETVALLMENIRLNLAELYDDTARNPDSMDL